MKGLNKGGRVGWWIDMRSNAESVKRGRRGLTVWSRLLHRPEVQGHLSHEGLQQPSRDCGTDKDPTSEMSHPCPLTNAT